ncbi:MAG: hemolysin family protein [Myxococcales bacterium]|nr:hemolysin family protein [Myxococcales bacterium]MDH5305765.1 hemolysin family protein [Myxococcales bacterium]MDH5565395.1 hemolysin family protein [Myxococcales bacterium]
MQPLQDSRATLDFVTFGWRLAATFFVVLLNGFFVAAEFALVKVRSTQIQARAEAGSSGAKAVQHILAHLDRYLSACQLGITIASLVLGWLAEPAVAELLLAGAVSAGFEIPVDDPVLHGIALGIALTLVTVLHMTVGEQAPKIWAIHHAESVAIQISRPLRIFASTFHFFIAIINTLANGLLRLVGLSAEELADTSSHSAEEIKRILATSAKSGHISARQLDLAQNVLDIFGLEVRHIMVPRVDVTYLTLQNSLEDNLRVVRETGHSRFPLCSFGLDSVIGVVHAKDVMAAVAAGAAPDLKTIARKPVFVSDTQSVSRLIYELQRSRSHSCMVLDEHGTTIGLAFLEDALEEIVGPIQDEFDAEMEPGVTRLGTGAVEMPGSLSLPEASEILDLDSLAEEADTIGGLIVAMLGRLPRRGDELTVGGYRARVLAVTRRRIERLRFEPLSADESAPSA